MILQDGYSLGAEGVCTGDISVGELRPERSNDDNGYAVKITEIYRHPSCLSRQ